jgi:hypothetical protein
VLVLAGAGRETSAGGVIVRLGRQGMVNLPMLPATILPYPTALLVHGERGSGRFQYRPLISRLFRRRDDILMNAIVLMVVAMMRRHTHRRHAETGLSRDGKVVLRQNVGGSIDRSIDRWRVQDGNAPMYCASRPHGKH